MEGSDSKLRKFLKDTKFPPEFDKKVNISNVNLEVMKGWIEKRIREILKSDDDVVTETCYGYLEEAKAKRFLNFKELQYNVTGFLEKEASAFCKELQRLCVSAQSSPQGVPQELVEEKKAELKREKEEAEKDAEAARRRRDNDEARDRDIDAIRHRERGDRGRGRGRYDGGRDRRDQDRRPQYPSRSPPDRDRRYRHGSRSRSPQYNGGRGYRRHSPAGRGRDTYGSRGGRGRDAYYQRRRRSPSSSSSSRSRLPSPRRRHRRSPPPRYTRPRIRDGRSPPPSEYEHRRRFTPSPRRHNEGRPSRGRRRSSPPSRNRKNTSSTMSSPSPSLSRSRSRSRGSPSPPRRSHFDPKHPRSSHKRRRSSSRREESRRKRRGDNDSRRKSTTSEDISHEKAKSTSSKDDGAPTRDVEGSKKLEQELKAKLIASRKAKQGSEGRPTSSGIDERRNSGTSAGFDGGGSPGYAPEKEIGT